MGFVRGCLSLALEVTVKPPWRTLSSPQGYSEPRVHLHRDTRLISLTESLFPCAVSSNHLTLRSLITLPTCCLFLLPASLPFDYTAFAYFISLYVLPTLTHFIFIIEASGGGGVLSIERE